MIFFFFDLELIALLFLQNQHKQKIINKRFEKAMEEKGDVFIKMGVYLIIEKLRGLILRNLIKVFLFFSFFFLFFHFILLFHIINHTLILLKKKIKYK